MRRAAILLYLLASVAAPAAEVAVTIVDGKLGARVESLAFPPTLQKDLTSGLTNRFYAQVSLADARVVIGQKFVEVTVRYDLWEEHFTLTTSLEGAPPAQRTLADSAAVNTWLSSLPLPALFDAATLPPTRELVLQVEVLLNPIDREKIRMIRKWVSQNSTPPQGSEQGVSVSNAIFNRLFEQYATGSDVAAAWRATVASEPFRVDRLRDAQR